MSLWAPGQELVLTGMRWREWASLARACYPPQRPDYLPRYLRLTLQSGLNELIARAEEQAQPPMAATGELPPPLFIVGSWRSGTSWLHQLLSCDPKLTTPRLLQVLNPHTFGFLEGRHSPPWARTLYGRWARMQWGSKLLRWRRISDDLQVGLQDAGEDELALLALGCSDLLSHLVGPAQATHWNRYLDLQLSACELQHWEQGWLWFLRRVCGPSPRRLLLKSPNHTARIAQIRRLWPQAQFVHLHRHPYEVFASLRGHLDRVERLGDRLQPRWRSPDEAALDRYARLYRAYFAQMPVADGGQWVQVAYADLCRDPLGELRRIYRSLELPGWPEFHPRVVELLAHRRDYRPRLHPPLSCSQRRRVARRWEDCFEAFGYSP